VFEYKVEIYKVKEAEQKMNALAEEGWHVITVTPNHAVGYGIQVVQARRQVENILGQLKRY